MATEAGLEVPAGMRRIRRRFERWRNSHQGRLPIPGEFWAAAAQAAREHGVFQTAKVLRLDYAKLKRMMNSSQPSSNAFEPAAFLELAAPAALGALECLIEMEGPRGKMRIQWKGATASDLAGLIRQWESA